MHKSLIEIQDHLNKVIEQLKTSIPSKEPIGIAQNDWSFPALTVEELIQEAQSIIDNIVESGKDELGEFEQLISDYPRRLDHLCSQTIPNIWDNAGQAVPAYQATLDGLRKALSPVLRTDMREELQKKIRQSNRQVRSMEARLNDLQPRTASLSEMVERIEAAYNAADQLPTDLEELSEGRDRMHELIRDATQDQGRLQDIQKEAGVIGKKLNKSVEEAEEILERCQTAYSAVTSIGLASAFFDRSKKLSFSMWFWIGSLVFALAAGSYLGTSQLIILSDLFRDNTNNTTAMALNIAATILSIGAPVWFAWLATKQIGQRFRLSEDYAFKAAVSSAYEGFRRETTRFDKDMEAKLLETALTRLDELPLRLVEVESYGSPWHELASSHIVKKAMNNVPEFPREVVSLARSKIGDFKSTKGRTTNKDTTAETEKE